MVILTGLTLVMQPWGHWVTMLAMVVSLPAIVAVDAWRGSKSDGRSICDTFRQRPWKTAILAFVLLVFWVGVIGLTWVQQSELPHAYKRLWSTLLYGSLLIFSVLHAATEFWTLKRTRKRDRAALMT